MGLKLALIDNRLRQHLALNGTMFDLIGNELVSKFIKAALGNGIVGRAARECGFDASDLTAVYVSMVECLRPNPCIRAAGVVLAASLPFMEPERIAEFMRVVHPHLDAGISILERRRLIEQAAEAHARALWDNYTKARGEAPFQIDPAGAGRSTSTGGCGIVTALGLAGAGALAWHFRHFLS